MSGPSVLVTGAAGYVGRLTVAALSARRDELTRLVALDVVDESVERRQAGVEYVVADVSTDDLAFLLRTHGIDTVVHLASIVRVPRAAPPDLAYRVDVKGTENVLESSVATGVQMIVVTSSGAAYGYHADNRAPLSEDDPLRGNAGFAYPHHKALVEAMLARYRQEHPELAQLVLRPGTVIGEGTKSPVTDLFDGPVVVGVAGSSSPFVFIWDRDLVEIMLLGVFQRRVGIYNLAGDGALTTSEIARRLHKPYVPVPAAMLQALLRLLRALGVTPYGPEQVDFVRYRPVLANDRLKEQFGYTPLGSVAAFDKWADARKSQRPPR